MITYCKKSFLIFLFGCTLQPIYAMNRENSQTPYSVLIITHIFPIIMSVYCHYKTTLASNAFQKVILQILNDNLEKNWKQEIKKYLHLGANINGAIDILGKEKTPFLLAIEHSNYKLVNFLLKCGVNPNDCGCRKNSLHIALKSSRDPDTKILEKLLKYGADPDAQTESGFTPLILACGNIATIKLLVQYGADVNKSDGNGFPLFYNIIYKNVDTIKILCNAGAFLHNLDIFGNNALHVALYSQLPRYDIEMLMAHACTPYNQKQDKQLKKMVMTVLCTLQRFKLPNDIRLKILSKLSSDFPHHRKGFTGKLYKKFLNMGFKNPLITQTNNQISFLEQLLQSPNRHGQTALQYLRTKYPVNNPYRNEVEYLLNIDKLKISRYLFNETLGDISQLPENDIARKIYEVKTQLLLNN